MKGPMNDIDAYLEAVFAPHEVPAAFRTTEAFGFVDDQRIYPFDDCNLPELGDNHLELWAGDPTKAAAMAHQLCIWLHGSSGCLYGFWSHDGRPMLESPIVYLDDEGCGNGVVANNLDEFLAIAANGFSRIAPAGCNPTSTSSRTRRPRPSSPPAASSPRWTTERGSRPRHELTPTSTPG